jgi:hypothetical protein
MTVLAAAYSHVRDCSWSLHDYLDCFDIKHIKDDHLIGTFWSTIHNHCMQRIAGINCLDPNTVNNIEQANLQHFLYGTHKIKHNDATKFIGFPLNISIGLLDNQDISITSLESLCTITRFVNWRGGGKEPWIAVWHVATCALAKRFSRNTKPIFLPFL